jgi:hypothetical protein
MAGDTSLGRLDAGEAGQSQVLDDPTKAYSAVLTKQDEIIDLLKALTAKLDGDVGITDVDYASSLTDALEKLAFRL